MEYEYLVAWKCDANGRLGRSQKLLRLEEAQQLASQLNEEHPGFQHIAVHKSTESLAGLFPQVPPPESPLTVYSFEGTSQHWPVKEEFIFPEVTDEDLAILQGDRPDSEAEAEAAQITNWNNQNGEE